MANVQPIPKGYHSVTPYLSVKNASEAIRFYAAAFGAREEYRLKMPDGGTAHAEISIGDSRIMLSDEMPAFGNKSAQTLGGSPASFLIYVEDADSAFDRAVKAGAEVKRPVKDEFYGDRVGTLVDPFGFQWSLATHKEDVSGEEMQKRMEKAFSKPAAAGS